MTTTSPETEIDRVRRHTSAAILREIDHEIEASIRHHLAQPQVAVTERIQQLDREWSTERWLETNAAALAFTGVALGLAVDKRWFALPLIVTGFLFQHAVQGWCPPLPILRRLGVRTRSEIDREKFALKMVRGDFESPSLEQPTQARKVLEAVNA